jgi:hypothetical protein
MFETANAFQPGLLFKFLKSLLQVVLKLAIPASALATSTVAQKTKALVINAKIIFESIICLLPNIFAASSKNNLDATN